MKFDDNLKNSTETVKAIFHLLCKEIEMMDVRGYPTNNGDYRFVRKDKGKGLIFCELIPKVRLKSIRVEIRIDKYPIPQSNITWLISPNKTKNGDWIKYDLVQVSNIPEVMNFIKCAYENSGV